MTPNSRPCADPEPHRLNPLSAVPYRLAGHLASLVAVVMPAGSGKVARAFAARRGAAAHLTQWARSQRDLSRPLLWIHAPSVGEGLMAKPLIERIRAARPEVQLAYTFFSPSAESFAMALPVDVTGYLPFDTASAAHGLLDALRPTALVFSKLDVWPILAEAAAARDIPTALISAALAPNSGRGSWLARLLLRDAYASLTAVGAVHGEDATRLRTLGVPPDRIVITGDTRYDQVWERIQTPGPGAAFAARLRSERPTIVAGSTWPVDELCVVTALRHARKQVPRLQVILAPHEPGNDALVRVQAAAAEAGLSVAAIRSANEETDIVWVDVMGILADLYALASVAYVGGGLHTKGLHSVIEPAAHGVPVIFGPRHLGSRDALALLQAGGAFVTRHGNDLGKQVVSLLADEAVRRTTGEQARGVVAAGLGAAERSAALVERLLR